MSRLEVDSLWPLLTALIILLAGALGLEEYARHRSSAEVVIEISGAGESSEVDEEGDPTEALSVEDRGSLSPTHAQARQAAQRMELPRALALYEELVAASPDSPQLHGELGYWRLVARDHPGAIAALERAALLAPSEPRFLLNLGLAHARSRELPAAERYLRRALALRPQDQSCQVALGRVLRKLGKLPEAISLLTAATDSGGNEQRAKAHLALGATLLSAKRTAEARASFERAVLLAPANVEVRLGVARAWLGTGEGDDAKVALQLLLRSAQLAPDLAPVHSALGRAYERTGDPAAAANAYEKALKLEPEYLYARRRLLRLALGRDDTAAAGGHARELLRLQPAEPEHHFLSGLVADRGEDVDGARRHYQEAVRVAGGDYPEALLNLGLLEKRARRFAESQAAYEEALRLRPDYVAAHNNLALLFASQRRYPEAEARFRRALAVDETYAAGWLNLGQVLVRQQRTEEALAAYQRALAVRPGYPEAQLNLAVALGRLGRVEEAIATYRALVEQQPRYVTGWHNLGLALASAKREAEAREALNEALRVDPEHIPTLRKLAELDARAGNTEDARRTYLQVLDLDPSDVVVRLALAELLARSGDTAGCTRLSRALQTEVTRADHRERLPTLCATAHRGP